MRPASIALNLVIALLLAGLLVPLGLLLPESFQSEWMAAVAIVVCVGLVFYVRRDRPRT